MRGRSCENNHSPTPIDGVWVVVLQSPRGRWQRAFFERNRAHLLVLRSVDGKDEQPSLRGGRGIVRIWETWLTKGNLIMEGSLDGAGQLVLEGRTDQYHGRVRLRREKPGVR